MNNTAQALVSGIKTKRKAKTGPEFNEFIGLCYRKEEKSDSQKYSEGYMKNSTCEIMRRDIQKQQGIFF